jgi:hypothetical protein
MDTSLTVLVAAPAASVNAVTSAGATSFVGVDAA